ncbi:hypothetical protein MDA_GLEAN10001737 [Myotis davidii]|uniref:Uncharacterized protein n=1 Tax=Myotis davidii TaxID=225400 RepID=L5LGF1_MYODS|nr:hypothetical protein MDA_GLEAN10001737 [Myotis davidii]
MPRPVIRPPAHVCAPTRYPGYRSHFAMHRMALNQPDEYDELETFFIWVRPNGRAVEVAEMQVARSVTTKQPSEAEKKNDESKKNN